MVADDWETETDFMRHAPPPSEDNTLRIPVTTPEGPFSQDAGHSETFSKSATPRIDKPAEFIDNEGTD
jgi:hypothetical protein